MVQYHEIVGEGVEFIIEGDGPNDPDRKSIEFRPQDDGTIEIIGRGPNGEKGGMIDPSGGSNSLGV